MHLLKEQPVCSFSLFRVPSMFDSSGVRVPLTT